WVRQEGLLSTLQSRFEPPVSSGYFRRQGQSNDDERLSPIGLHDQHVATVEPAVQFPKAVRAAFDFDSPIDAEHRHAEIGARLVHAADLRRRDALSLQQAHDGAFGASALIAGPAATHAARFLRSLAMITTEAVSRRS